MTWRGIIAVALLLGAVPAPAAAAPVGKSPAAKEPSVPAAPVPAKAPPSPLVVEGKTLFYIRETVLAVTPEQRVRESGARLGKLLKDRTFPPGAIRVVDDDVGSVILGDDMPILRVFDRDAAAEGVTRQELAARYADAIRAAVEAHNREYSFQSLLFGAIYSVVATGILVAILLLYRVVFPRVYAALRAWGGTRIRSVHVGSYELLGATRLMGTLVALVRWFRILTTVALVYAWLLYTLSRFPWTRGISTAILGYILAPLGEFGAAILTALPDLFVLAVIAFITRYASKTVRFFFEEVEKGRVVLPGFYADWAIPTYKIVRFFLIAFALTVAFPYIPGSKSDAFKGVSIFLGVLFSLGSTSVISNVMGGLTITYMRAFKVGDRVRIGDTTGDVIDQTLLVTHIRTIKNEDITVPNSMVMNAHIVNYSARAREEGLILHTTVTIGYDAPWRKVHELLLEAARKTQHILPEPKPFVLQTALNDFYVTYELNAHTDDPQRMVDTYSALHRNIQDSFNEGGVEIMSPHYTQLRDGNKTTIPGSYLPPDYVPGALRIAPVPGEPRKPSGGRSDDAAKPAGEGGPEPTAG
jgi:small-conductance mechanosensitive channel